MTRLFPIAITTCAISLLFASAASAQETKLYDWPDEKAPVVIVGKKGVLFLHKDGKPYRAYSWSPNKGDVVAHVVDIDKDGGPDIVGVGTPTFAIATNGDPMWFLKKGCKIGLVGDMAFDEKLEILCSDKKKLKVITHDNQQAWEMSLGRSFSSCQLGDTNGDFKADVECNLSKSRIARVDGNGTLITAEGEESIITTEAYEPFAAVGEEVITDKKLYDFDQDGTAEEYIVFEDNLLQINSKSRPKGLSTIDLSSKPTATLVKDLDGDGKMEVVVLTEKEVVVLSTDGKRKDRFSLDAKKYKRAPVAELQSVYANGFASDETAQKSIQALEGDLAKCYASTVKKSKFAGSGQLLLEVKVDDKGKVTKINKLHSEIADSAVVKCAQKTLKKAKTGGASEGNQATVNVTMYFTFRDQ